MNSQKKKPGCRTCGGCGKIFYPGDKTGAENAFIPVLLGWPYLAPGVVLLSKTCPDCSSCSTCGGSGWDGKCYICGGTGMDKKGQEHISSDMHNNCPDCGGIGRVERNIEPSKRKQNEISRTN